MMKETGPEVEQSKEGEKLKEPQSNPLANIIPEGYEEDDAQPSIVWEDLEEENDVWIFECPATADPSLLLGKTISFSKKTTIKNDDESTERYISIPYKKSDNVCCLLSSSVEKSIKSVGLQYAGKIKVNTSYHVPESGSMLPDAPKVPVPEGLKVRHPFLGPNYEKVLITMNNIKEKMPVDSYEEDVHVKKKTKKKKKSMDLDAVADSFPEWNDDRSTFVERNQQKVKEEIFKSPERAIKKKKHVNHDTNNNGYSEDVPYIVDEIQQDHHKSKKKKDKMCISEQADEYLSQQESDVILLSPKKSKKRKRESSYEEVIDLNSQEISELNNSEHHSYSSKKIKMEKAIITLHTEDESIDEVDISVLSPKKKKKKRGSICEEGDPIVIEPQQDNFNGSESFKKSAKKIKKEKLSTLYGDDVDNLPSQECGAIDDDHVQINVKSSKKIKREKCPLEEKYIPEQNFGSPELMSDTKKHLKKLKKRHTMIEADFAKIADSLGQASENKFIEISPINKREPGIELSNIDLEKKPMEYDLEGGSKEKRKKKLRHSCLPVML